MSFDRLLGAYLNRVINAPRVSANEYYRDSMSVFKQNLENFSRAYGGVDIRKPFYGYTLTDSMKVEGDDLLNAGFYLNTVSYYNLANAASTVYVRIPHVHSFERPESFATALEEKMFYSRHTICTLDPTLFRQEMVLSKNRLVKIQFLDDSLSRGIIIGMAGETHGGLGRLLKPAESQAVGMPMLDPYPFSPPPGAAAFIGVSTMYNIHHAALEYARRKGYDVNMLYRACPTQTGACHRSQTANGGPVYGELQEAGMTIIRFLSEKLPAVLSDPARLQFYSQFKYVFIDLGRNDQFFSANNDMTPGFPKANTDKVKQQLKIIFSNPEVKFISIKPTCGYYSTSKDADPRNACVTEYPDPGSGCGDKDKRFRALLPTGFAAQCIKTYYYEQDTGQFLSLKPFPNSNRVQIAQVENGTYDWSKVKDPPEQGGPRTDGHPGNNSYGVIPTGELCAKIVFGEQIDLNNDFDNLDLIKPGVIKRGESNKPPTTPWTVEYQKSLLYYTPEELMAQNISATNHPAINFMSSTQTVTETSAGTP